MSEINSTYLIDNEWNEFEELINKGFLKTLNAKKEDSTKFIDEAFKYLEYRLTHIHLSLFRSDYNQTISRIIEIIKNALNDNVNFSLEDFLHYFTRHSFEPRNEHGQDGEGKEIAKTNFRFYMFYRLTNCQAYDKLDTLNEYVFEPNMVVEEMAHCFDPNYQIPLINAYLLFIWFSPEYINLKNSQTASDILSVIEVCPLPIIKGYILMLPVINIDENPWYGENRSLSKIIRGLYNFSANDVQAKEDPLSVMASYIVVYNEKFSIDDHLKAFNCNCFIRNSWIMGFQENNKFQMLWRFYGFESTQQGTEPPFVMTKTDDENFGSKEAKQHRLQRLKNFINDQEILNKYRLDKKIFSK